MGIVFRQSVKTTIVTLTGAVLGGLVTYVYTYTLSQAEYGLTTNIIFTCAIAQILVMMGTGSLIAIFTQRYKYEDLHRKALFTFGLLITFIASLVFGGLFIIMKSSILNLYNEQDRVLISKYYYLVPLLVIIWGIMSILDCYLVAHVKIAVSAFSREIILRLCNLLLLGMLYFNVLDFHQYIISSVLIYLIPVAILYVISSKTKGFGFTAKFNIFTRTEFKEMIHFSWYHLLIVASVAILSYLDTLMLAPLDKNGLKSSALYAIAAFIASIIYMPYRAMSVTSLPILNQAYLEQDNDKIKDLFSRAGINIIVVAIGMFLVIGLNLDNAVAILPHGYEAVKPLVLILMIGKLIDMATGLNSELISVSKYYKFNFRVTAVLLILVYILYTIYIPKYGMYGAAWVTTCSLIVFNVVKMVFLYWKMKMQPFTKKTWLVFVAGLIAALAGYICPYILNPIVDAIVRSVVICIIYCLMLLWLKPSADLVTYFGHIKESKRLF